MGGRGKCRYSIEGHLAAVKTFSVFEHEDLKLILVFSHFRFLTCFESPPHHADPRLFSMQGSVASILGGREEQAQQDQEASPWT